MPKATAVFDADDSRLGAVLARINGRMLALQSRIAKIAGAFLAVRAAASVVTVGYNHFKQALDVGGALNDLSANTGVAVGDLVVLQQEFANAGKSAEDIGPVFGKMTVLPNLGVGIPYRSRSFTQEDDGGFKVTLHYEGMVAALTKSTEVIAHNSAIIEQIQRKLMN